MRRGETDGQIFFNHHNEGIHMSEQTTHTTNDTVDPQFLGPEGLQQAGGEKELLADGCGSCCESCLCGSRSHF